MSVTGSDVKRPKCSSCKKEAEFYYEKEHGTRNRYFCNDHAVEFLKDGKADFLPRIKGE